MIYKIDRYRFKVRKKDPFALVELSRLKSDTITCSRFSNGKKQNY